MLPDPFHGFTKWIPNEVDPGGFGSTTLPIMKVIQP